MVRRVLGVSVPLVLACTSSSSATSAASPREPSLQHDELLFDTERRDDADSEPIAEPEPPLGRDEIRLVVRAKLPEVRACFELGLAEQPTLAGRVALRFTIDAMGRVRDAGVADDQIGIEPVTRCLLDSLAHWQFPLPAGGRELTIVYPFHFTAEEALRADALPRVEGTLRPAAVAEPFAAHRASLDACLREAAVTSGTLGVAFTLDDTGTVTKIASYSSSLPEAATRCLLRTISSWTFPAAAPGDVVTVNHDLAWD